jgi:hypothetical protein
MARKTNVLELLNDFPDKEKKNYILLDFLYNIKKSGMFGYSSTLEDFLLSISNKLSFTIDEIKSYYEFNGIKTLDDSVSYDRIIKDEFDYLKEQNGYDESEKRLLAIFPKGTVRVLNGDDSFEAKKENLIRDVLGSISNDASILADKRMEDLEKLHQEKLEEAQRHFNERLRLQEEKHKLKEFKKDIKKKKRMKK